MRYPATEKLEIIRLVEQSPLPVRHTLAKLGIPRAGIVNLHGRGVLLVSVARRLGSEGPLLAYCAAPISPSGAAKRRPWLR